MAIYSYKIITLLLVIVAGSFLPCSAIAESPLVATVGGVPVTRFELQREINRLMPMMVSFHGGVSKEKSEEIKARALEGLLERGMKICFAKQHDFSIPASEVELLIEKARNKMTPSEFERAVAKETLPALRASVYRKLLAEEVEKTVIDEKVIVSEEALQLHYQQNKQNYFRPRQYRASHILIKVDPALTDQQKAELKTKAEGLLQRARAGENFYNLAYYNSDDRTKFVGGDLGLFHEGQTDPAFEEALRGLEVDNVSNLVRTLYGYHIIKLVERNEPRQLEFAEVADKIRARLEQEQRAELYANWLQSLRADCPVELPAD